MPEESNEQAGARLSFIRDEPAKEDRFGSHTRLASAIGRVITQDSDIKIIGILGAWGSGKSTVVRAVENVLTRQSERIHFFTYDAWIHQSDPVRRSFLESLVLFLDGKNRVEVTKWNERLEGLNGAVEKTETETTPVLTNSGRLLFASLAFVPFGLAIMGYDGAKDAFGIWAGWPAIVGLAFSLAPVFAALAIYLSWRPWGTKVFTGVFWSRHKSPHEKDSIVGILSDRTVDRVLSITARRPEPTSIEFQEIFREIMTEATAENHRFVFVIDNLDRLAEREALQIWSAVRAFFLGSSDEVVDMASSYLPTVILPVDANSIRRMFAVEHGETDAKDLAKAFMDKTFDVTFEVPEPVLSDWQDYLANQLKSALGEEINSSEVYWITRFIDEHRRLNAVKVTPRLLNRHVNRIVAHYLHRPNDNVKLLCAAYYAVFSDYMKSDIVAFFGGSDVAVTPPVPDWQNEIAAIHYGVEPDKASQVLLTQPITDAIASQDKTTFEQLATIPGFGAELYRALSNPPLEGKDNAAQFDFISNASMLMHDSLAGSEAWLDDAWLLLLNGYIRSSTPDVIPPDFEHRMQALFSHANDRLRRPVIQATASKISSFLGSTSVLSESFGLVVGAAERLLEQATSWAISLPELWPDIDAGTFISLLARTSARPHVWRQLRNHATSADLAAILAQRLKTPMDFVTVTPSLRVMLHPDFKGSGKSPTFDWSGLITAADDRLRNGSGSEPNAAECAIVLGLLQRHSDAARSSLQDLVDQGLVKQRVDEAAPSEQYQLLTSAYAFLIMLGGDFGPPARWTWDKFFEKTPNADSEIAAKILEFFGPVVTPKIWAGLNGAPTAQALILRLISTMLNQGRLGSLVVSDIVGNLNVYLAPLSAAQRKRFLQLLKSYNTFFETLADAGTGDNFIVLIDYLVEFGQEDRQRALTILQNRLDNITEAAWAEAIKNSSEPFTIASKFAGSFRNFGTKTALFRGLESLAGEILASTDRDFIRRWFSAARWLTADAQAKALRTVADKIAEGKFVADLLAILRVDDGRLLSAAGLKPGSILRTVMVPLLATAGGRKWILSEATFLVPLIRRAPREATAAFQVEVDRLARSPIGGRQKDAEKLRRAFQLK